MSKLQISPVGLKLKSFEISVELSIRGSALLHEVFLMCGEAEIKLIFKGRTLAPDKTLAEIGIQPGSKLILMKSDNKTPKLQERPSSGIPSEPPIIQQPPNPPSRPDRAVYISLSETSISNIFVWGSNTSSKLGIPGCDTLLSPQALIPKHALEISQITCGAYSTSAIDSNGNLYHWGRCLYLKEDNPQFCNKSEPWLIEEIGNFRFTKVTAGTGHTLALDSRGDIWSWGDGLQGQLGHGVLDNEYFPKRIETLQGMRFIDIAAGGQHSIGLLHNGNSIIWGRNQAGQLGTDDKEDRLNPTILLDFKADSIKCGSWHTLWQKGQQIYISGNSKLKPQVLNENAKLYTCGGCYSLVLTTDNLLKVFDEDLKERCEDIVGVKEVVSNGTNILMLLDDGRLMAKGDNKCGYLGLGDSLGRKNWAVSRVAGCVKSVACGTSHVCAVVESMDLANDLGKALSLPGKDTVIYCEDGVINAHKLLLANHTQPEKVFECTTGGFSCNLKVKAADYIVKWLYSGKVNWRVQYEELECIYFYAKDKGSEKLAEVLKELFDFRTLDHDYLLNYPEYKAADLINAMTAEERKRQAHKEQEHKKRREIYNNSEDDEENALPAGLQAVQSSDEEMAPEFEPVLPNEEKRRRILEAYERRMNQ